MIKLNRLIIREANSNDLSTLISWWASDELSKYVRFSHGIQTNVEKLKTELEKQNLYIKR